MARRQGQRMSWTPIGTLTNDTTILECDCGALVRETNEHTHHCTLTCTSLHDDTQCELTNNHPDQHTAGIYTRWQTTWDDPP